MKRFDLFRLPGFRCGNLWFGLGYLVAIATTGMTQTTLHERVVITPATGYSIEWDGNNGAFYDPEIGAIAPENEGSSWLGTSTFASSSLAPGGAHDHPYVNDGWYGNHSAWIADFVLPDPDPFVGLAFHRTVQIQSIAWSRDNGDDYEPHGGILRDRAVGVYTLQVTRVAAPTADTSDTGNPATGWATIGTVEYLPGTDDIFFSAYLRHRFDVAQGGNPIPATGLRIKVSDPGIAIDEIEVNPPADPDPPLLSLVQLNSAEGFGLTWNGNDGLFSEPGIESANAASAALGAQAFASSQLSGFPVARVNDGLFGNAWRPNTTDSAPFVGVRFAEPVDILSLGWSRDNTGVSTDRALGAYTVQVTRVANPGEQTTETGDPATGWVTVGTVAYQGAAQNFSPQLLHMFDVSGPGAAQATGLRILLSSAELAIDEVMVNPNMAVALGLIIIQREPGFDIRWDGNEGEFSNRPVPQNDALIVSGTTVFASSELEGYGGIHEMKGANDGFYGNSNSWISGPTLGADPDPWIGLNFGRVVQITNLAWGRANAVPTFGDRWDGIYTLQVTMVANPGVDTWETGDASTGWVTVGQVEYRGSTAGFRPWLRHRFEVSSNGNPISARGIRILVSNNGICIDEIEVNAPKPTPAPGVIVTAVDGYSIVWDGNEGSRKAEGTAPHNVALAAWGTVAFGSSEADFDVHFIRNVNDGLYGNAHSWIARFTEPPDPAPFIGLDFGRILGVRSVAWGRDNRDDGFQDRSLGTYVLQVTTVNAPGVDTPETGNPSTGWVTIATVEYDQETPVFRPWLRHRYDVARADGSPIFATGLRIKPPSNQTAIDEIEVNPAERITIAAEPGFTIIWDGNEGEYFDAAFPALAPDNPALAAQGAVAFGSSELDWGVHYIHLVNDGHYGNSHSWIPDFTWPDPEPFIGINFNQTVEIQSIAWGRDNGDETHAACDGTCTDRSLGIYTLQITRVAAPGLDTQETENASTGWLTLGTVTYTGTDDSFSPWLRHRFEVSQAGAPIAATGLRIKVPDSQTCIDEIEVNSPVPIAEPPSSLSVEWVGGELRIAWTGSGVLQSAQAVAGDYADVPGATTSPQNVQPTEVRRFYRLRQP
jgi:hypothetical protein